MKNPEEHLIFLVLEQLTDEAYGAVNKYCADEISERESRDRIAMAEHVISRLNYEGQAPEILALLEKYSDILTIQRKRLQTIDMKKQAYLRKLQQEI